VLWVRQLGPVLPAKRQPTSDSVGRGCEIVAWGAGWLEGEWGAFAPPPFADRGSATDEFIAAFKVLWTEDSPAFVGTHANFNDLIFAPKPVRKPHPPIWIGGGKAAALRRGAPGGGGGGPAPPNPHYLPPPPPHLHARASPPPPP